MGVVVDGVSEVLNIAASDIEETPDFGRGGSAAYLLGMAKIKGQVKILLDIDQALDSSEGVAWRPYSTRRIELDSERIKIPRSEINSMTIGRKSL